MSPASTIRLRLAAALWISSAGICAADAPVLEQIHLPSEWMALAVSADGTRAALAIPNEGKARSSRTRLELHSTASTEPVRIKITGIVQDLLFDASGASLFVLEHRPAKRGEGQSGLLVIDFDDADTRGRLHLSTTVRSLALAGDGQSLLIPMRDEIRTISLPLLRSGPLYRVTGDNRTVSPTADSRIVVGQDAAILVIDLADPQDREGMPIRQRIETPAAVHSLEFQAANNEIVARLTDGSERTLRLDPQAAAAPAEPAPQAAIEVPLPDLDDPPDVLSPATRPADPPTTPEATTRASDDSPLAPAAEAQARGSVEGAPADLVLSVVFLGPDNLLREARRVPVGPDGRWQVSGLASGRYRVQLDAGGSRALISDPPFRLLELADDEGPAAIADFRVTRAL